MMSNDKQDGPQKVDLKKLKPYGDIMGDGTIQICFTLPVEASAEAREAAVQIVEKMGLDHIKVATMENVARGFSMFVVYANVRNTVDFTKIEVVKVESKTQSREDLDVLIENHIGRKLVILGACTGYDAHTVGIDAIMNMKGFAGDYGLERYQWLDARNLGAQVLNEELIKLAVSEKADAILVSKVVTQHNIHIRDLKDLISRAKKAGLMERLIFVAGGPRVTHPLALECGFDAGFGVGTKPSDVASYVVEEFLRRREKFDGIPNPLKPVHTPAEKKTAKPSAKTKKKPKASKRKLVVKFRTKKTSPTRKASPRKKPKK
jgi:beta-lysine 5,6-aminomutase beta subunit